MVVLVVGFHGSTLLGWRYFPSLPEQASGSLMRAERGNIGREEEKNTRRKIIGIEVHLFLGRNI
jgi:hypothetical protein